MVSIVKKFKDGTFKFENFDPGSLREFCPLDPEGAKEIIFSIEEPYGYSSRLYINDCYFNHKNFSLKHDDGIFQRLKLTATLFQTIA